MPIKPLFDEVQHYLFEEASVFLIITNKEGKVEKANAFTKTLFGKKLENQPVKNLFVNFQSDFDLQKMVAESDKTYLLNVNTLSGLPQTFYFNFYPINDKILILGKIDIEEVEHLRKQLVSANTELTNLTRQLQKANAELTKLNRLKNQFLGMAAHDLRKPSGLIHNSAEILIDEIGFQLSEEHQRFLNNIELYSQYMSNIIADFLDYSLIEAGRFELDLQLTDISELINRCIELVHYQLKQRSINIKTTLDHTISLLMIDASKIEQVITNILSNAIEHSQDHSTVWIKTKENDKQFFLTIKDQGEGMSNEVLSKLFKPFDHRSSKKRNRKKSIGLGMSIAKIIINSHQGKIWAESEPGNGSEFFVTLPIITKGKMSKDKGTFKNNASEYALQNTLNKSAKALQQPESEVSNEGGDYV